MPRLYTRVKRKLNITSSATGKFRNTVAKHRPKTFSTEEFARAYATETLKLEKGSFDIVPAKKDKRFRVLAK